MVKDSTKSDSASEKTIPVVNQTDIEVEVKLETVEDNQDDDDDEVIEVKEVTVIPPYSMS